MPLKDTSYSFRKSIEIFEDYLIVFLSDIRCMSSTDLIQKRLLKRKHYVYAAFLAVISSFPILRMNIPIQDILRAIIAKIAEIVSIKSLDNINDLLHTKEQAVKSLEIQLEAFTSDSFSLQDRRDEIGRAENSMYQLAYFTNQLVSKTTNREGPAFDLYLKDFFRFIKGQTLSMNQKLKKKSIVNIREFLKDVNEKGVGRIWVAVDFCFLNSFWYLDKEDFQTINHIKRGLDLIFKGCNIYDDVCDFEVDFQEKILNSVIFLALDKGIIKKRDLSNDPKVLQSKLEKDGAMYSAFELGNLLFLNGLKELDKGKNYASKIDIDALKFGVYILRLFAMRKWFIKQFKPWHISKANSLKVSDNILEYEKYL
jgi:hypothetical protein